MELIEQAFSPQPEETEKRLNGSALAGHPIIALDNASGTIEGDLLCQITERPLLQLRPLGTSKLVRAANTFIDQLPANALVGAVAFSSSPDGVQAPTTNHSAARSVINSQAANGATATGDALQLALQLLHGGQRKRPPSAIAARGCAILPEAISICVPPVVAIFAASILVRMPPRDSSDSASPAIASISAVTLSITGISLAFGFCDGGAL